MSKLQGQSQPLKIPSVGGVVRSDSGRGAPGWVAPPFQNSSEVPPHARGNSIFINVAPPDGMKNSIEANPYFVLRPSNFALH